MSVIAIDRDGIASLAQSQKNNFNEIQGRTQVLKTAIDGLDVGLEKAEKKDRSRQLRVDFEKGSRELRTSIQRAVENAKAALGSHWSSRAIRQRTLSQSPDATERMMYLQTLSTSALESAANEALRTRDPLAAAAAYEEVQKRHEQGRIDPKISNLLRDQIGNLLDPAELETRDQLFDIVALGIDADLVTAEAISSSAIHPINRLQAHRRQAAIRRGEGF